MKEGGLLIVLVTIVNTSDHSLAEAAYLVEPYLCDMQDRALSF